MYLIFIINNLQIFNIFGKPLKLASELVDHSSKALRFPALKK
jgi:hypothetical protein